MTAEHPSMHLPSLLAAMDPVLHDGVYVYSSVPHATDLTGVDCLATFRETEGLTVVLAQQQARERGFPILFRAAWITLTVHSALPAVGLTAAIATALRDAGISCNVMAGACHDHLFVPVEQAQAAMAALRALQRESPS